jgi:hypothetical protein
MPTPHLIVSADGTGDFNTVQAAMDFVPDHSGKRVTINVRNGIYEEIVYFRSKDNVTLRGESETGTLVRYANNEVFNPHPANIRTNPQAGTFPSRRAAVSVDNSNGIHIINMTLQTTAPGQAEGLLITGDRNILSHVTVIGSGDALQANGRIYMVDSTVYGTGDTILGRGTPTPPLWLARRAMRQSPIQMLKSSCSTAQWTILQLKVGAMPTKAVTCTSGNITVTIRTARRSISATGSPGPVNSTPWPMRNELPTTAVRSSCWPAGSRRPRACTEAGATFRHSHFGKTSGKLLATPREAVNVFPYSILFLRAVADSSHR